MVGVDRAYDGSSYGMGLSATSSAIERSLDFIYICYDNEGYGNAGQQFSEATPHGVREDPGAFCPSFSARAKRSDDCRNSGNGGCILGIGELRDM